MISLPEIASYSLAQRQQVAQQWPAVSRYLSLVDVKPETFSDQLRHIRHEAWLRCALATYFSTASTENICAFWSHSATQLLKQAWSKTDAAQLPVALFALGKLGAGELNLSSDVDLLMVRADGSEISFRHMRSFQSLLSESTSFGFCLRLDFDLRPGGRAGSPIPSESEFENHYGYYGETWERLALVRLQYICGDHEVAKRILQKAHRFSYQRHLDYSLLEDLKLLRPRIHASSPTLQADEFNLKLGIGGIRDVELFFHALQVIHGGKNEAIRTPSTTQAVEKLISHHIYPEQDAKYLLESYWFFRNLENHLQGASDQQTYVIASHDHARLHLPDFFLEVQTRSKRVDQMVEDLLGRAERTPSQLPPSIEEQQKWLENMKFSKVSIDTTWPELIASTALSRSIERDERARLRFLEMFVTALHKIGSDRDLGLTLLRDFTRSVRAKATFFSLFLHEPKLIDEVAWLFSTSPYLGTLLASRPELLDSFIFRRQGFSNTEDMDAFLESLVDRRILNEVITASQFLVGRDLEALQSALTFTADEIVMALLARLKQDYPQSRLGILALGKWGGEELGLRSDLDFILMTPENPNEDDHRVARRLISRLSESHKAGAMYNVDLRLRPTGRAGPIISSEPQLQKYLQSEANVWERQAYLRARPLAQMTFSPSREASQRLVLEAERIELLRIRQELLKKEDGSLDLKLHPGGLVDIEFTAQIAMLTHQLAPTSGSTRSMIRQLVAHDKGWGKMGSVLDEHYQVLRLAEQLLQLTSQRSGSAMTMEQESFQRLARIYGTAPHDLYAQLQHRLHESATLLKHLDPLQASR